MYIHVCSHRQNYRNVCHLIHYDAYFVYAQSAALTEAKLKMSDINAALHICTLLHQRYADFSTVFMENWNKVLLTKKDDKVPNPSKLRVDLRYSTLHITFSFSYPNCD